MSWFNKTIFKLGRMSPEAMKRDVDEFQRTGNIAPVVPYLAGRGVKLGEELEDYYNHLVIEWLKDPRGPPPSVVVGVIRELLEKGTQLVSADEIMSEKLEGEEDLL